MAELPQTKSNLYVEETEYRGAVSEALLQKAGSAINFINYRQHSEKQFFINGPYGQVSSYPVLGVDGLIMFEFNAEIFDVMAFNMVASGSGTTQLDAKLYHSGSWTSIFSTKPAFTSSAAASVYTYVGAPAQTGVTAPVLTSTTVTVAAKDALRIDLLSALTQGENTGLVIYYRPI